MCLSRSLHQFRAQICHKPRRAKSLRLAAAYTSYGAADKILRRLTAYEVYGGLLRLTAAAKGSTDNWNCSNSNCGRHNSRRYHRRMLKVGGGFDHVTIYSQRPFKVKRSNFKVTV